MKWQLYFLAEPSLKYTSSYFLYKLLFLLHYHYYLNEKTIIVFKIMRLNSFIIKIIFTL